MKYLKLFELFDSKPKKLYNIISKFYIDRDNNAYVKFSDKEGNIIDMSFIYYKNGDSVVMPNTVFLRFTVNNHLSSNKKKPIRYYLNLMNTLSIYVKEYVQKVKPSFVIADGNQKKSKIYKYLFSKFKPDNYKLDIDHIYAILIKEKKEHIDYDFIVKSLVDREGWGNVITTEIPKFEKSSDFIDITNNEDYILMFNIYLNKKFKSNPTNKYSKDNYIVGKQPTDFYTKST